MAKIVFFISLFALFMQGVSDVNKVSISVSALSGDSVTLHTDVETHQQEKIRWFINSIRIAQINADKSKICTDVQCNNGTEKYRDRLELDNQTGSLTITNIRTTDAGVYILEIINYNISEQKFIVAVHGVSEQDQMKRNSTKEGKSITLYPGVIKNLNDVMTWCFNDTLIAEITGDQVKFCTDAQCDERFRDRLKLDHQTGSLTITNSRTTDSGEYQLQINSRGFSILKRFSVNVTDSYAETSALHGSLDGLTIIGITVIVALIVASAAGVILSLCTKAKQKGQKYGVEIVLKVVGKSVILNTGIVVQTDDHIKWMFGDKMSLIAEIKEGTGDITVYNEDGDEKFIDRLELDNQTGSLTIRNSRTTDSGDYKLQIIRKRKTSFKKFRVTVSDSSENTEIQLFQNEIAEFKMPLMQKLPTNSV